jgi:hypothetical protein
MDEDERNLKHSDLLYDYIKFHFGLYVATPAVLVIVATALGIEKNPYFQKGMIGLIAVFFLAGVHASWTIATYINVNWKTDQNWAEFGKKAGSCARRFMHHYLYWIGLIFGLGGIVCAWLWGPVAKPTVAGVWESNQNFLSQVSRRQMRSRSC